MRTISLISFLATVLPGAAYADDFEEVGNSWGVSGYVRAPSASLQTVHDFQEGSLVNPVVPGPPSLVHLPVEAHGWPGVAILDYDNDHDLDIIVTNGPGAANALYQNQLTQTGNVSFVDKAVEAGLATITEDMNGVCYGDTDNDGDPDVLLLGRDAPVRFFVNDGDGTFHHPGNPELEAGSLSSNSCTMGDVNGDGLLDIFVANSFPYDVGFVGIFASPFDVNQKNQLFLNEGNNQFRDVSERVEALDLIPAGAGTITWAATMVDIDHDGDMDIIFGDDQGGLPTIAQDPVNGVDRGYVHILYNDGSGHFDPYAIADRPEASGSWMGLSVGDLNHDGLLDVFGSNFGDYALGFVGVPFEFGGHGTRPLFNVGDGTFADPDIPEATAFGWGTAAFDYDNDADTDVLYHGSLDMLFVTLADNPGVIMENDGHGNLATNLAALGGRHQRRNIHGVAIGDLDRDQNVDVVSVSNFVIPDFAPFVPGPFSYGDPLDPFAVFVPVFAPAPENPSLFEWTGIRNSPGNLSIERNLGSSGNGGVTVRATGSVGTLVTGVAPRDGTGAVFSFKPRHTSTVASMPITAGSSHTSAHAQEAYFGLGQASFGRLDVLWPGGVRNRLYGVHSGEYINFPEIPCSIEAQVPFTRYWRCVKKSTTRLRRAGVINHRESKRFQLSALLAFFHK